MSTTNNEWPNDAWNESPELETLNDLMNATPDADRMASIRKDLTLPARRSPWMAAAVVLLAVATGFAGGRLTAPTPVAPGAGPDRYLITLHEDAAFNAPPVEQSVAEYGAWGEDLARRGQLVGAEKLVEVRPVVLSAGSETAWPEAEPLMTGFFMVRASSEEEALAIARTMPHLKYGGSVTVHPVEDLSKYEQ